MSPVKELLEACKRSQEKGPSRRKGKVTYAIARPEDFETVEEMILSNLVQGRLTYFALTVADLTVFSSCFFSPAAPLKKGGYSIFV